MEAPKFEVKVISSETIKPSSPTPSHLQKLTISFLDQKYAPHLAPGILFFSAPDGASPLDITHLKTCLSETLTHFYPLAGQYQTWGTLLCNDYGVPFTVARVNCSLSSVIDSPLLSRVDFLSFYPPKDDILPSRIHIAIQVNVFSCGGFAVARYYTHKVMDGISSALFFRHWSAFVTNRYEVAAQAEPDFNAGAAAFPPVPDEGSPVTMAAAPALKEEGETTKGEKNNSSWNFTFEKTIVVRSFVFKDEAINILKAKSISDKVTYTSRFEAVTGFLWKHILLASPEEGHSMLKIPVNLRPKTNPPLPSGSMGNLFEFTYARAHNRAELRDMVSEIRESTSKMNNVAKEYQGEKRLEEHNRLLRQFINTVIECKGKDIYFVNSLCKSTGFGDIDFGSGKPVWMVPFDDAVNHNRRNGIILTDSTNSNDDGIEAWLFLEEDTIRSLESNLEFLGFASPKF
ncbi:hypothetical protein RND81_04G035400 [Saponaria officinalis]|uniref:Transferase n=1 Tax=Saponaria officinalis TaxID=3572 RepID=A0AAW1LI37_SAPOF